MCGRYSLTADPRAVAEAFDLAEPPADLPPRYNVAPSQPVPVVGLKPDGVTRGLARLRWGLVPSWASSPNDGPRPINARAETVLDRPTFREPFRRKRCLLPATGFYEWQTVSAKGKRPHHFALAGGGVFAFAGLWDCWGDGRERLTTC